MLGILSIAMLQMLKMLYDVKSSCPLCCSGWHAALLNKGSVQKVMCLIIIRWWRQLQRK